MRASWACSPGQTVVQREVTTLATVQPDTPPGLRFETVRETDVDEPRRAALADLLSSCFDAVDAPSASTSPLIPQLRVVGCDPDGRPVVHQAVRIVALADDRRPPAALGDLCVHPDWRGRGLARFAIAQGITLAEGLSDVVLTRTTVVAEVFASLGFVRADERALALRDGRWDPVSNVWAKARTGLPEPPLHLSSPLF
jgi:GNAT superfamily N-acetyltransferase